MVSEQTMLFSSIELKLFLAFSHLLNNEITNNLYVGDCVILWPFVFVTLAVSSFLYLNIFQWAPNLVQIILNAILRDVFFFNFYGFYWLFFWDFANILRWNPDYFHIKFLWFLWCKWTILRVFHKGVCCAKWVFFE